MQMVLVAKMFDPSHSAQAVIAAGFADTHMLGTRSDRCSQRRPREIGHKLAGQEVDGRTAQARRNVDIRGIP